MRLSVLAICALLGVAACEEKNTYVAPPPPKVSVAAPVIMEVTDFLTFTGKTQAAAVVEVRARVPGYLQTISFEPGTYVAAGDPLFIIDQREYIADLEIAKAQLKAAEAQKVEADAALARAESLITRGNVSQAKLDESRAAARTSAAEVSVKQASVRQAELNLEYTDIRAPIDGRIGRNLVDVGNLVGESGATHLTTITDGDPMYVYFNINERDLLTVMEKARGDAASDSPAKPGNYAVEMSIGDQQGYPFTGALDFSESALNAGTGTLQLRARFDNPGPRPALLSGLFVRLRVPISKRPDMPLVTERAVGLDQGGRYVYVLGAENVAEKRSVVVGQLVDGLLVIESGLAAGEKVVVNGLQRVRDGSKVDPEEAQMADYSARAPAAEGEGAAQPTQSVSTDAKSTN